MHVRFSLMTRLFLAAVVTISVFRAQGQSTGATARVAIVRDELAFAADALARGTKPAFLAAMHDSAIIMVRAVPALAKPYWSGRPEPTPVDPKLRWAPGVAGAALSGDLGYTLGPWLLNGPAGRLLATGHFFTIWQRQPDGSYKWLFDNGVSSPPASAPARLPNREEVRAGPGGSQEGKGWRQKPQALDEQLSAAIGESGMEAAYTVRLHPRAHVFREEQEPLTTAGAIRAQLSGEKAWKLRPAGGQVAASGELAYSYGQYEAAGESGSYVHLWLHTEQGWRLLAEMTNVAPPAGR